MTVGTSWDILGPCWHDKPAEPGEPSRKSSLARRVYSGHEKGGSLFLWTMLPDVGTDASLGYFPTMFDTSIFFSQVEAGLDKVFTVEIENSRFSSL